MCVKCKLKTLKFKCKLKTHKSIIRDKLRVLLSLPHLLFSEKIAKQWPQAPNLTDVAAVQPLSVTVQASRTESQKLWPESRAHHAIPDVGEPQPAKEPLLHPTAAGCCDSGLLSST